MMDTSQENFDIMRLKNYIIQVTLSVGTSDIFYFSLSLHDFSSGSFRSIQLSFDDRGVGAELQIQYLIKKIEETHQNVILFYAVFRIRFLTFPFPGPVVQFSIKEPYPEGQLITDLDATWPLKEYVKNTVGST